MVNQTVGTLTSLQELYRLIMAVMATLQVQYYQVATLTGPHHQVVGTYNKVVVIRVWSQEVGMVLHKDYRHLGCYKVVGPG